ncbi:hypothetical protein Tco_0641935 [Tanacetum coccineum]
MNITNKITTEATQADNIKVVGMTTKNQFSSLEYMEDPFNFYDAGQMCKQVNLEDGRLPRVELSDSEVDEDLVMEQPLNAKNKDVVDVMVIAQMAQVLHVKIKNKADNKVLFCSFVYASNSTIERHILWADLGLHKLVTRNMPWVLMGDFTVALNMEDVNSGSSVLSSPMCEFKDCVANIEVLDINRSYAVFQSYRNSDHSPSVLKLPSIVLPKPRPFKFFNFLTHKNSFLDVLHNSWSCNVEGHNMFKIVTKLKALKTPMRKLMHAHGNLHERVRNLRIELDTVQKALDTNPTNPFLYEEEATYLSAFNEAKLDEERFLKQKAKINWLDVGDLNKAYFHKTVKSKNSRSRIDILLDSNNDEVTCVSVSKAFVNHYESFLGNAYDCDPLDVEGLFVKMVLSSISADMDLMHNYHRNQGPPRCAFKVDIQKAYDTVDWHFLEQVLGCFGFPITMIKWVMACVSSALFSICLNGDVHGFLKGKRRLRQGDPLSPFLFMIVMEGLDEFKKVSGLVPSIPKSTAFFCNVSSHVKLSILNILPFSKGKLLIKNLGVPLISSRLLIKDCKALVEQAKNRIGDWKNKSLSFAGRLQLCTSVISSMQVYWASVLLIPKVAWDVISLPKTEGGLGIHNLDVFNIAFMTKHIWNIISNCNGVSMSLLFDNWYGHSPIARLFTPRDVANDGFSMTCRVADLVANGGWTWLRGVLSMFSVSKAWEELRSRGFEVRWASVVWYSHCIPRHAFHLWLTLRGSLKTQDKLRQGDTGSADLTLIRFPLCDLGYGLRDYVDLEFYSNTHGYSTLPLLAHIWGDTDWYLKPQVTGELAVMSSASSVVTYTAVYIDSESGRPVASPSPDYIPSPEEPQTPPVPQDEDECEPMFIQPHDPNYVPEPIYPKYIPLEDEHEFPVEEQQLPPVDSPIDEAPGYVTESDPDEDLEEYEDDETEDGPVDYPMDGGEDGDDDDDDLSGDDADDEDEEDEEDDEEEEHLAPADSAIIVPTIKLVSLPEGIEPVIPPPSTDITSTGARITVRL